MPWWAHRRRRAKVRVERTLAAWPEIAEAVGLAGSRVMSAVVDVWGWRARFALARGQTIADVIAKLPAIESGLGTVPGRRPRRTRPPTTWPTGSSCASWTWTRTPTRSPGPARRSPRSPSRSTSARSRTPRRPGCCSCAATRCSAGQTGSGKSGGLNVLMGNLTACRDVVIWAIDLKRGMELGPWASCIDRLATTPAEARALLADAVAILEGPRRAPRRDRPAGLGALPGHARAGGHRG